LKELIQAYKDVAIAAFMEKPFTVAMLLNNIKEVLGENKQ
jgi:hypothetical protein